MDMLWYLTLGLLVGTVIGVLIGKYVMRSPASVELAASTERISAQAEQIEYLKGQLESLIEQEKSRASEESAVLERLAPVQTLLTQVEGRVREMENERKTQFQSIKDQLDLSRRDSEALRTVTQGLRTALADPNVRGYWGETQVERLFEAAGLVKGIDYVTQDQVQGEEGESNQRPDAVVMLPDGGRIVVDVKTPLTHYLQANEAPDEKSRKLLMDKHAKSVADKVKELGEKKYWQKYEQSASYVIMYIPTEAAFTDALQSDPSIYDTALKLNVAIATPISLFTTLKSVAFLWRQHAESNEIHEVISKTRSLINALAKTADKVNDFAKSLNATVNNYNTFASWFENSLISAAVEIPGVTTGEFDPLVQGNGKNARQIPQKRIDKISLGNTDLPELTAESTIDTHGDESP